MFVLLTVVISLKLLFVAVGRLIQRVSNHNLLILFMDHYILVSIYFIFFQTKTSISCDKSQHELGIDVQS